MSGAIQKQRLVRFVAPKKDQKQREMIRLLGVKVPLLKPGNRFVEWWTHLMMGPMTYEAWAIPFRLAISSPGRPG